MRWGKLRITWGVEPPPPRPAPRYSAFPEVIGIDVGDLLIMQEDINEKAWLFVLEQSGEGARPLLLIERALIHAAGRLEKARAAGIERAEHLVQER